MLCIMKKQVRRAGSRAAQTGQDVPRKVFPSEPAGSADVCALGLHEVLRMSTDRASDAVFWMDPNGHFVHVNDAACSALGYTREELLKLGVTDIDPLYSADVFRSHWEELQARRFLRFETEHQRKDGTRYPVEITTTLYEYAGVRHGIAFVHSISGRKQTEQALRLTQFALDHAPEAVLWVDHSGRFAYVNDTACQYLGYTRPELMALSMADLNPFYRDDLWPKYWETFQNSGHLTFETLLRRKSGTLSPVEAAATFLEYEGNQLGFVYVRDITERKSSEQALKESEGRFRRLLESVTDYIYSVRVADGQARETVHSPGCEAITGYAPEDYLQDPNLWTRMVHADDLPAVLDQARLAIAGQAVGPLEHRLRTKDGRLRWVRNTPVVRRNERGRVVMYEGLISDITERKEAEEALRQAKEAADGANRAKSVFLANMSHEIRTPMNAILGMTQLVLKRELGEQQREFLEGVREAGMSLMQVINDILDFSKIEAGKIILEQEDFDLTEALQSVIRTFSMQAARKGLELRLTLAPGTPSWLSGDAGRLRQVMLNLVGNAVKFTEKGQVEVSVRSESEMGEFEADDRPRGVRLFFSVRDTGIGIPQEKQDVIFDSFSQADASTTRRFGGTGLGLAISQRLVGMMGGKIRVTSIMGQGSNFFFTAAFDVPGEETRLESRTVVQGSENCLPEDACLRILLVEDDPLNQMFAEEYLREAGHRVTLASNGLEALKFLSRDRFDLVLMDISMPEMDGIETTSRIRSAPMDGSLDPRIPIIALTAHALKGDRERFLRAGMDGYVSKPLDVETLTRVIRSVFQDREHSHPGPGIK